MWEKIKNSIVLWLVLFVVIVFWLGVWLKWNNINPISYEVFGFPIYFLMMGLSFFMGLSMANFVLRLSDRLEKEEALEGLQLAVGKKVVVTLCYDVEVFNGKIVGYPSPKRYFGAKKGCYLHGENYTTLYICTKKDKGEAS